MTASASHSRATAMQALAESRHADALAALADVWRGSPCLATAQFIGSQITAFRRQVPLTQARVYIARSFTLEPAAVLLRGMGLLSGFDLDVKVGGFDAYAQEMLDPESQLCKFDPQVVFLAVQTRAVAPDLWDRFSSMSPAEVDEAVERTIAGYTSWVKSLRSRSSAHVVVHLLEAPPFGSAGLMEAGGGLTQTQAIGRINAGLRELAGAIPGVHLLDYERLMSLHGKLAWEDARKWASIRMPLTPESLVHLAGEWLCFLHPLTGRAAKVLVCDLDNTLWGGILGEDGREGIRLGDDAEGAGYRALQHAILDLYHRGIVLAICSKNEEAEALAALREHPNMLLRPEHFAAWRINWQDKASNLREIAAELNVGIDALAFLDDNPHERDWVRRQLPQVRVIELAEDPVEYAAAVRREPVFERLALTDEDRQRGQMYAEQRQRRELQAGAGSLEDYYRSLGLVVEIGRVRPATLERAAQLIGKTNQFNLTGRRYSVQELEERMASSADLLLTARVKDRFGDSGIVGAIIAHVDNGICVVDTLVMSCRVIGRTVETAMLAALTRVACEAGALRVCGSFAPSSRNQPAADFYRKHGFACTAKNGGASRWEYDLSGGPLASPPWIDLQYAEEVAV